MISAGRVLIVPRGEWDENTTYHMLDLVNRNGYAYLAKRTVIGIEPSDDYPDYWHNMLDINKIVKDAIAGTLAEDVGDILEARFRDMLSEARYVDNLMADYETPTFVQWNAETQNTPYTEGLTSCTEGFALVHGAAAAEHTITAWTTGGEHPENFTHNISGGTDNGWDKAITASGGTMTGPLGLGSGKGSVSADDNGSYIEAKQNDSNTNRLFVANPLKSEANRSDAVKLLAKFGGVDFFFNLFGEHNLDLIAECGFARVEFGTYEGDGESYDKTIKMKKIVPRFVLITDGVRVAFFMNPCTRGVCYFGSNIDENYTLTWNDEEKSLSFKLGVSAHDDSLNADGITYYYMTLG